MTGAIVNKFWEVFGVNQAEEDEEYIVGEDDEEVDEVVEDDDEEYIVGEEDEETDEVVEEDDEEYIVGEDEEEALRTMVQIIEDGLGE